MAKRKKKDTPVLPEAAAPAPAVPKPMTLEERVPALEARVAELEGDLRRLSALLGKQFGEPLASQAREIAEKRQGR